jgi:hypothetical protein
MRTIWERFENALGTAITHVTTSSVTTRRYTIHVEGNAMTIDAEYAGAGVLCLSCASLLPSDDSRALLRSNWESRFWKAAFSHRVVIAQTEIFADDFEDARAIICGLRSLASPTAAEESPVPNHATSFVTTDHLRLRRLRASLLADLTNPAETNDGGFSYPVQPSGSSTSFNLRCLPVEDHRLRITAPLDHQYVSNVETMHYLLCRNRDLVGCRTALDPGGIPHLVADIPFSAIEREGASRRMDLLADNLFDLRHAVSLRDPQVSQLYHHIHIQKGEVPHGHIA